MRVDPLAGRPEAAVRIALSAHGWEGDLARTTALGTESLAFHLTGLSTATLEALVRGGSKLGIDVVTGDDWALLSGPRARLSALARPWTSPEALVELATALGHALPAEVPSMWHTARGCLPLERPVLVGILNVTPDSFSDGGLHNTLDLALRRAEALFEQGAAILDVGGESTRPGAAPVPEAEELARVIPIIKAIERRLTPSAQTGKSVGQYISVDTTKAGVARAALDAGAAIVNDVSGLRLDPGMAALCADRNAGVVLMHSRGGAGNLASLEHARYPEGVLPAVIRELGLAVEHARTAGVEPANLVIDPGLGFGKTVDQNVELLRGLRTLSVLGLPVMVGPSRKRFVGDLTGRGVPDRDVATAAVCAMAWQEGASLFRVHAPAEARDALALARAIHPR